MSVPENRQEWPTASLYTGEGTNPGTVSGLEVGGSGQKPAAQAAVSLLPSVTLPKGGGALKGIGEKTSVNAAFGTSSVSIPLPFSASRAPLAEVGLSYDSGAGNGPFGFGWNLSVPSITRKTDKGLPKYGDGIESDVFIFAGAEDLVPLLGIDGQRVSSLRTLFGVSYQVFEYRPRIEGPLPGLNDGEARLRGERSGAVSRETM